ATTLLAFGWLVYTLASNSQATAQDDALKQRATDALGLIARAPVGELNRSAGTSLSGAEDLRKRTDIFLEVLTSSGTIISSTGRIGDSAPAVPATLIAGARLADLRSRAAAAQDRGGHGRLDRAHARPQTTSAAGFPKG